MFSKKFLNYKITKYLRTILSTDSQSLSVCKKLIQLYLTLYIFAHTRPVYTTNYNEANNMITQVM